MQKIVPVVGVEPAGDGGGVSSTVSPVVAILSDVTLPVSLFMLIFAP